MVGDEDRGAFVYLSAGGGRFGEPQALGELFRDRLNAHAKPAAAHFAVVP